MAERDTSPPGSEAHAHGTEPPPPAGGRESARVAVPWWFAGGLIVGMAISAVVWLALGHEGPGAVTIWERYAGEETDATLAADIDAPEAIMYCAGCHALPPPEALPANRWPQVIDQMNKVIDYHRLGQPMTDEQMQRITDWYVARAPSQLPELTSEGSASPISFVPSRFSDAPMGSEDGGPPAIGDLRIVDLNDDGEPEVLISDIGNSALRLAERDDRGQWRERTLAAIDAPAQFDVGDVNQSGDPDIVVADLGTIRPTNDLVGRVVLLENDGEQRFTARTLVRNLARMSDVRIVDLNGSGRKDILFAAFGLYRNGQIGWLEQMADGTFEHHAIFLGNGVSHVRVADLNRNGRHDFIALISQEHQQIIAFLNEGDGQFSQRMLHQAPHPLWGYSSLELVDLNGNGRQDVLLANGDAFDFDTAPQPYHGVQWLENHGDLAFTTHDVFNFYGAYRAVAADLNDNGHLDLIVSSMANKWDEDGRQSVIWLENDGQQNFTPRRLSASPTSQVAIAAGDLTGDGRVDVLTGGLYDIIPRPERFGRLTLWWNRGPAN